MIQPNEFTFRFDLNDFKSKRELINSVRLTRKLYTDTDFLNKFNAGIDNFNLNDYKTTLIFFAPKMSENRQVVFQFDVNSNTNKLEIEKLVSKIYSMGNDPIFVESIGGDGYEISIDEDLNLLIYSNNG